MHTLTAEQRTELIELINDECGSQLGFDEFTEKVLGLFDDIPGLETIPQRASTQIISQLWSKYHGQESRSEAKQTGR